MNFHFSIESIGSFLVFSLWFILFCCLMFLIYYTIDRDVIWWLGDFLFLGMSNRIYHSSHYTPTRKEEAQAVSIFIDVTWPARGSKLKSIGQRSRVDAELTSSSLTPRETSEKDPAVAGLYVWKQYASCHLYSAWSHEAVWSLNIRI